jgi:hypothetical protein
MSRWWWLLTGALVTTGAVWLAIEVATMGQAARDDASTYGAFALALLGVLIPVFRTVASRLILNPGTPDLDQLTDDLATVVLTQWERAAQDRELLPHPLPIRWRRSTHPVAGRLSDAPPPGPTTLNPLPGIDRVTTRQLQQGTHRMLHTIYGGLPSGRLILLGQPGAGKSAAAILLLRDALRYRDQHEPDDRAHIPVPVLFTLHGWNPDTTPVHNWITTTLTTQIPLLSQPRHRGHAATLLATGRIAVFLDGLDEIPEPLRARALDALSTQTTFRLVLLTRTTELITAAQHHTLTGAVALELQPLTVTDAQDYLRQPMTEPPPPRWQRLLTQLTEHPDSPLARALSTPLTITLLRAIYTPTHTPGSPVGEVDELLDTTRFPQPDDITQHLLDQAITAAYTPRPGHPAARYTRETAHRTLALIAEHLRDATTRDLAWWTISAWLPPTQRVLINLLIALPIGLTVGQTVGLSLGLVAGMLAFGIDYRTTGPPTFVGRVSWRRFLSRPTSMARLGLGLAFGLRDWLGLGLAVGLMAGLAAVLAARLGLGLTVGLMAGLGVELMVGLVVGLVAASVGEPADILGPQQLQRSSRTSGLTVGLALGLPFGLIFGLPFGLGVGLGVGLWVGLVAGLSGSAAWRVSVCQIYLHVRYRTPLRLLRFLEDAHARHLLRTVGAVYQFRHATLQDRLAPPSCP